jgi:hypothetical protein
MNLNRERRLSSPILITAHTESSEPAASAERPSSCSVTSLTDRQEHALVALYRARAFGHQSRQSVRVLVERGYLADSRYAGPLAALADRGLVQNRHQLIKRNWGTVDWWLTDEGRAVAYVLW